MGPRTWLYRWVIARVECLICGSVGRAVVRAVREETGLEVQPTGLVGIYSDPGHEIAYANGEVRQEFSFTRRTGVLALA